MQLDELQQVWKQYDQNVSVLIKKNRHNFIEVKLEKTQSALTKLSWKLFIEAGLTFVILLLTGSFLADHFREIKFCIPAIVLHASVVCIFMAIIFQIKTIRQIDFSEPLTLVQKQMETFRLMDLRILKWVLLCAPLLWVPLAIVLFKAFLNVDIYDYVSNTYIIVNIIFGVSFIPLMIWFAKKYLTHKPFFRRILDEESGHLLKTASRFLRDIIEFENDSKD